MKKYPFKFGKRREVVTGKVYPEAAHGYLTCDIVGQIIAQLHVFDPQEGSILQVIRRQRIGIITGIVGARTRPQAMENPLELTFWA